MKRIMKGANFSVVLPGECNASCRFCFWRRWGDESEHFVQSLLGHLDLLGDAVTQVSITGGEPMLSPWLKIVLRVLADRDLKVVLTTNGYNLDKTELKNMSGVVNHINISRHAVKDQENQQIFGTSLVPNQIELALICELANRTGIDVTLNRVVHQKYCDWQNFMGYVRWARLTGASAICLRSNYAQASLDSIPIEDHLGKPIGQRGCPVCITTSYICLGMPVHVKRSLPETYQPDSDHIHEIIMHPDGRLYEDWEAKHPIIDIQTNRTPYQPKLYQGVNCQTSTGWPGGGC